MKLQAPTLLGWRLTDILFRAGIFPSAVPKRIGDQF
jgi:hypothetical protein